MDYNTQPQQMPPPSEISKNAFLTASVICAVLSLMSSCVVFAAMFFAGMSILFAVLSKGKELKIALAGKTAVIVSAASLAFSVIITAFSVYTVMSNPETRQEFYDQYEEMTGISLEDEMNQLESLYQQ